MLYNGVAVALPDGLASTTGPITATVQGVAVRFAGGPVATQAGTAYLVAGQRLDNVH